SKAGLIGLAHSLAATLAPHGITVNAIAPGLIMTDMLAGDPRLETLERGVPVGRLGQPAEVADVIVAVVRNAYMTGQTVSVGGGRSPRGRPRVESTHARDSRRPPGARPGDDRRGWRRR